MNVSRRNKAVYWSCIIVAMVLLMCASMVPWWYGIAGSTRVTAYLGHTRLCVRDIGCATVPWWQRNFRVSRDRVARHAHTLNIPPLQRTVDQTVSAQSPGCGDAIQRAECRARAREGALATADGEYPPLLTTAPVITESLAALLALAAALTALAAVPAATWTVTLYLVLAVMAQLWLVPSAAHLHAGQCHGCAYLYSLSLSLSLQDRSACCLAPASMELLI
jgi:hypothetical protein